MKSKTSIAMREAGYKVTASDMMTYSYHHLNVLLKLQKAPEFKGLQNEIDLNKFKNISLFEASNYEGVLNYLNNLAPIKGYFWKEFSPDGNPTDTEKPRKYFTSSNAAKIDAIRNEIKRFKEENLITEIEHSLLLHDLIMAANDIANIAGTYGHYLSEFVSRAKDPIGVSGLRPWRDQYSNFCSKVKIRGSIDEIFSSLQCKDILFSYSEDGLLEIEELLEFLESYGDVSKNNITHKRFKSNDSSLSSELTEYLIHIHKN